MSDSPKKLRILVPLDGSQMGEESLHHALALAEVFASEVLLLQVVGSSREERGHSCASVDWQLRERQASAYLERLIQRLRAHGVAARQYVESGSPAPSIVRFAKERKVDLIVISRTGQTGVSRFGSGSVARKVISATDASVLLLGNDAVDRGAEKPSYRRILVPVDDSPGAEWAVALASSIAGIHDATLSLIRVLETPCHDIRLPETSELKALLERVRVISQSQAARRFSELRSHVPEQIDVTTATLNSDRVSDEIARFAKEADADLVVLCAHGTSGRHPWRYGATAEFLLEHSTKPVLVFQQGNEVSAQHYRSLYCQNGSLEAS